MKPTAGIEQRASWAIVDSASAPARRPAPQLRELTPAEREEAKIAALKGAHMSLTLDEIARAAGVSRATISNWCNSTHCQHDAVFAARFEEARSAGGRRSWHLGPAARAEAKRTILGLIGVGKSPTEACRQANVSRRILSNWREPGHRQYDEDFAATFARARDAAFVRTQGLRKLAEEEELPEARRCPIDMGGRISASSAASRYRVKLWTLCRCISDGLIPGAQRVRRGRKWLYLVDVEQFEAYLVARPQCEHPGCEATALIGSRACCGGHASGVATAGTTRTSETRGKIAAAKRGRRRPEMVLYHADSAWHYAQQVAAMNGRKWRPYTPKVRGQILGRHHGLEAARRLGRIKGRAPVWEREPDKVAMLETLLTSHPSWGRASLARATGLTESEIRSAKAHLAGC